MEHLLVDHSGIIIINAVPYTGCHYLTLRRKRKMRPKTEEMRDLVRECGLDWQRGYMPLFEGDPTNRYEVLIEAAIDKQEKLISFIMKEWVPDSITREDIEELMK